LAAFSPAWIVEYAPPDLATTMVFPVPVVVG
jgi:hypothetical protein